jgi:hypothetical protein
VVLELCRAPVRKLQLTVTNVDPGLRESRELLFQKRLASAQRLSQTQARCVSCLCAQNLEVRPNALVYLIHFACLTPT